MYVEAYVMTGVEGQAEEISQAGSSNLLRE